MDESSVPRSRPAAGGPGTPGPGAADAIPAVPSRCPTRTRMYRRGVLVEEGFAAERLGELLHSHPDAVLWLDLFDPDEADLGIVTAEFGLHPLAVEDALHDHQRPKLDRYPTHLFANMYAVTLSPGSTELRSGEISAFITSRALVTVRKSDVDIDTLVARWDAAPELAHGGVGFLVHGLLDVVMDSHYAVMQALDDAIDDLEDAVFEPRATADVRRRGFALRKSVVRLRRATVPMRDVVGELSRPDGTLALVTPELAPYYQDVADHAARVVDGLETAREMVNSVLETNLNEQGNELNAITRKLAAWAAIIAVPTAVTGFFGQNVPYPGFSAQSGFVGSTVTIVVLAGGIWLLLRRRGWL